MADQVMPMPGTTPPPPWMWPRAAYVHIPFCVHHCCYCDFAVAVGQDHLRDRYVDALTAELALLLSEPQPVCSLFLGGGTPTYLDCRQLDRLLTTLRQWLPLAGEGTEFSIEANPDGFDADRIAILADHGINRVSLGVQSFQPEMLRFLERRHRSADVYRAVDRLRQRIAHVSLDLIFGVPGQTFQQWDDDLRQALSLQPAHLSTYGLTYEKGTRLWKQREQGVVRPLDEEAELVLYAHAIDVLGKAGFEHYEISNFARPGCRSRHNQVYWANEAYFGFGVGAARYVNGRRELNTRSLPTYLDRVLAGQSATFQAEELEAADRARETLALQLRRANGIHRPTFLVQTGFDLDDLAGPTVDRHVELGLLQDDGVSVRLTR